MRIGVVQMAVTDGNVETNVARAETLIREVVAKGAASGQGALDVVLLPELWTTGYACEMWGEVADRATPQVLGRLSALCIELGVRIGGTMVTRRDDGGLANRFTLIGSNGNVQMTYDKSHLFSPMREKEFLAPGSARAHTDVNGTPAALSICYDLRFPGMYRASAHEGVELFLVASAWPQPRCAALRTLATARAVENQAFLVLCNRVGPAADGTQFCGGSMVVSPIGEILLDLGSSEGVGVADIRIREAALTRSMLRVLDDEIAGVDQFTRC
jgi:predicted amidohydrolase